MIKITYIKEINISQRDKRSSYNLNQVYYNDYWTDYNLISFWDSEIYKAYDLENSFYHYCCRDIYGKY